MKIYIQNHISRDCSKLKEIAEQHAPCEVFTDKSGFYQMKDDEFYVKGLLDNYKRMLEAIVKDNDEMPIMWQDDITPVEDWFEELEANKEIIKGKLTCFFALRNQTTEKIIGGDQKIVRVAKNYFYAPFVYMPPEIAQKFLDLFAEQPDGYIWERTTATKSGKRIAGEDGAIKKLKGVEVYMYNRVLAIHPHKENDASILGNNRTARRFFL